MCLKNFWCRCTKQAMMLWYVRAAGISDPLFFSCRSGEKEINELIVVTILVAVEGALNFPVLNSLEDLRTVLNRLGGIGTDQARTFPN